MFLYLRSYKNYLPCKLQKPDEARLSMSLCPPSLLPYLPMTPPPPDSYSYSYTVGSGYEITRNLMTSSSLY